MVAHPGTAGLEPLEPRLFLEGSGLVTEPLLPGDGTPVIDVPAAGPPVGRFAVDPTVVTVPVPDGSADDPAIWIHPTDSTRSLILGAAKSGGLYVYDLQGQQVQHLADGSINNVDLRYGFLLNGQRVDLVTASNRSTDTIEAFTIDETGLTPLGSIPTGITVYGYAAAHDQETGRFYGFVSSKRGQVEQWEFTGVNGFAGSRVRVLQVNGETEGMVSDDQLGLVYVAEEQGSIYKYGLDPGAGAQRFEIDSASGPHLTADIEGLAIYYGKDGTGYLIASSQGAHEFVLYAREGANPFLATFSVTGATVTDGIDVANVPLGSAFPLGAFIAQNDNMDFRIVPWEAMAAAGNLSISTANPFEGTVDNGVNDPPSVVIPIADLALGHGATTVVDYADLDVVFEDLDHLDRELRYDIESNTNPSLLVVGIDQGGALDLVITPGGFGAADITVRATDPGGLTTQDTFTVTVAPPPSIAQVLIASSTWAPGFLGAVDPGRGLGIPLALGTREQLVPLSWIGLDRLAVVFHDATPVGQSDVKVLGVNQGVYAIEDFQYDSGTRTASWTFHPGGEPGAGRVDADKLRIELFAGDISFRVNILGGDVNGSGAVLGDDIVRVRNARLESIGTEGFDPRHDLDGSGSIEDADIAEVRLRQFSVVPADEPLMTAALGSSVAEGTEAGVEPGVPAPNIARSGGRDPIASTLVWSWWATTGADRGPLFQGQRIGLTIESFLSPWNEPEPHPRLRPGK